MEREEEGEGDGREGEMESRRRAAKERIKVEAEGEKAPNVSRIKGMKRAPEEAAKRRYLVFLLVS